MNEEVNSDEGQNINVRSHRNKLIPIRLVDWQLISDDEIGSDGELMNFAMLADVEPIYYIIAMQDKAQKEAMIK